MSRFLFALLLSTSFTLAAEREIINRGTLPNDRTGDAPWTYLGKINNNFEALFSGTAEISDTGQARANIGAATHVNTLADLLNLSGAARTNTVNVLGRVTKGDGGGGPFYWDPTSTTTSTNLGTCFAPGGVLSTGRWIRAQSSPVDVRWFLPAYGSDCTAAFRDAFACADNGGILDLPEGEFDISDDLDIPRQCVIRGTGTTVDNGFRGTTLKFATGKGLRHVQTPREFDHLKIQDFAIWGAGTGTGITFYESHDFIVDNVRVYNFEHGITMEECWDAYFVNTQADGNESCGFKLIQHVTDVTLDTCQFSNNDGYGFHFDTTSPQDIQMIRFSGGSMQYNKLGNWINGGIDIFVDNVHFENNFGSDLRIGSATNRSENIHLRANHYDWSNTQYTNAEALWPGATFSPYQLDIQNARVLTCADNFLNLATTQGWNRTAVRVLSPSESIELNHKSSILGLAWESEVPLQITNPNSNLIPNGIMTRDEAAPDSYPMGWTTDYPHTNYVGLSRSVAGVKGYTYQFTLTNGVGFRQIAPGITAGAAPASNNYAFNYQLTPHRIYTYSTLLKGPVGTKTMLHFVDRSFWDNGTNSYSDTYNVVTNTGNYMWVGSRYDCDGTNKTNPYLFTTTTETGVVVPVEIGEVAFALGQGVPGVSWSDGFQGGSNRRFKQFASSAPATGDFITGDPVYNLRTGYGQPIFWTCLTNDPMTWLPVYPTPSIIDDGTNVGIGVGSPGKKLHVYSETGYDGIGVDGTQVPAIAFMRSGSVRGLMGTVTTAGLLYSDSLENDIAITPNAGRLLLGGQNGGGAATVSISATNVAVAGTLQLLDGTIKLVTFGTNDSGGIGKKVLVIDN